MNNDLRFNPDRRPFKDHLDEEHPRAGLLRMKAGIRARWPEPTPKTITTARFVDFCARRPVACDDVHRWFVQHPS